ncbi:MULTISPECIES: PadR family transcriptional regulator [Enterococcus]|uniref:PadR family transcriptional regulator n=1 Tax=Enterococcus sulfureus ATCC 49903 TaxID=1140003 RepID=S0LAK7_9ENTE|nr:PadR family transcriptional regulator [Enterococcus sulfureus]EOT48586.1 hypothetical protein OMY_00541 [Enterococcus sulfureus ATCC 49903]EOT87478.1 hypothetical protein I573_00534 [Enterococcus sulfureus ATCC 49903]
MPRPRILPYLITGMLTKKHILSGKEILHEFKYEIGEFWTVSHTQLYPELNRMATEGLIHPVEHPDETSNKTIYYELTSEGRSLFDSWIQEVVTEENEQYSILKIYFLKETDQKIIRHILQTTYDIHEQKLQRLFTRQTLLNNELKPKTDHYGHFLILSRAIDRETHHLAWLKHYLEQ